MYKLPCFCPMNVENHTNYEHTQTHTRIEKIIPQKVAQNLNEPFKEKGNKNYDFIAFSDNKDALKMLVPSHDVGFKGRVS